MGAAHAVLMRAPIGVYAAQYAWRAVFETRQHGWLGLVLFDDPQS
jgi:hypothetical protein